MEVERGDPRVVGSSVLCGAGTARRVTVGQLGAEGGLRFSVRQLLASS